MSPGTEYSLPGGESNKMPTFTEVMVEVADCHTTLYHLGSTPPPNPRLPLSDAPSYASLYSTIAAAKTETYAGISGQPGVMLKNLSPIYRKNHYWHHFFGTDDLAQYPGRAWEFLAPILCTINLRVDFALGARFNIKVSPVPYVVLYPFGWSNCLSLRLQGNFALQDLADFNTSLFADKSFTIAAAVAGQPATHVSVSDLFAKMSDGVRADAFGGTSANDFAPKEPIVVTTIMASYGGNLKLKGLSGNERQVLLRIVKPEGPPPSGTFTDYVHRLKADDKEKYVEKYVVMNNYGRFTWMQDRLIPAGRNYEHLRCNHNNTFNSLVHARHLYQLLTQAVNLSSLPASLSFLANRANRALGSPILYYKSASLRGFLLDPDLAAVRKQMEKFSPQKTN
jgi:hypothetical protein